MEKTRGILLRRREIRETSLIVSVFTRDLGKLHGLIKGVRGMAGAAPWYLEPLTLQSLVVYERKRSNLALISAADLLEAFDPVRRDLNRTAFGLLCLEMVDAMTELRDPHPEIFDALLAVLRALERHPDSRTPVRYLELHLMRLNGLLPDPDRLSLSPGGRLSARRVLSTPPEGLSRLRLDGRVQAELGRACLGLERRLLGRDLKARLFLRALGLEEGPAPFDPQRGLAPLGAQGGRPLRESGRAA